MEYVYPLQETHNQFPHHHMVRTIEDILRHLTTLYLIVLYNSLTFLSSQLNKLIHMVKVILMPPW